ncbi:Hsp20/alpha crystallin family protein [Acidihalobacter ferrooxydans]|uniref:Heat-shock protein n=1 Tax=Acidihalobacter ferrooxydans TaxID=1765967 RepID=A0A1P8UJ28_9GAMM|nr:Hsp20/alpha crystallin family protein [Acidihalobacter ferrooxydans]APZ43823.1 heat-shock protein [Acidihalobacter ferrooxydans]
MSDQSTLQQTEAAQTPQSTASERVLRPAVDIIEDATGITLKADLPGTSRDRLEIQVEGDTLTLSGEVSIDIPDGMEALYADVSTTRYRRSFTLSKELDLDNIGAELKNGELTLRLPKRAEVQPRRIEVSVG